MKKIIKLIYKYKMYVKYVISGGMAAAVDLVLLYFFTDILDIWYIASASLAFVMAFFVSFFMQKFWTFRDNSRDKMYSQMTIYFILGAVNLGINALGMFILVDKFFTSYIIAQIIMGGLIAISSFLVYRFVIFSQPMHNANDKNKKIKILIATGIYPPDIGGPARMLKALSMGLRENGYEIRIITYSKSKEREDNIIRIKKGMLAKLFYFIKMYKQSRWADLIYATDTYSVGRFAYILKKICKQKYIIRFAGDSAWEIAFVNKWIKDDMKEFQKKKYSSKIENLKDKRKKILKSADGIIAVSNFMNEQAQKIGASKNKIKTIYNSIDFIRSNFDSNLKNKLNLENSRVILTGGRLVAIKAIDKLIKTFAIIKQETQFNDLKLLIIGSGLDQNSLKEQARKSKFNSDIIFTGAVSMAEISSYYNLAQVFVLNSIHESFSHMLLEAINLGKPVIATRGGGNLEIIENEKTGLLVNYGDEKELSLAIIRILNEEKFHSEKFREKCRQSIKRFSWENNIKETKEFINYVLNE